MSDLIALLANQEKTMNIIRNVSTYVIYIYPGIISLYLLYFFEAKNIKETNAFVIKSFAISYIYNILLQQWTFYENREVEYNSLLILISLLTPYFVYRMKYGKILLCICNWLKIRTCIDSRAFELLKGEDEKYTFLKIYLKDSEVIYLGYMENYELEMTTENFVILTSYRKATQKKDGKLKFLIRNNIQDANDKVYIKCSEIKCIEKISQKKAKNFYA